MGSYPDSITLSQWVTPNAIYRGEDNQRSENINIESEDGEREGEAESAKQRVRESGGGGESAEAEKKALRSRRPSRNGDERKRQE